MCPAPNPVTARNLWLGLHFDEQFMAYGKN